ncbi:SNF2 family helicase, putative [Cryptosporidium muris RN66]|uniref:SNF2 family helicase, putative n=1 Tax=Cryptosporidium muris (strain RN66) TaxID=441375 RepID=B6AJZ0_CRYMR|nr:SNF2 family helicase, putative [Cryptosporidium muris RN66]EEA08531.1 SNF2 family helicase, putative [Cryptosporidium muris RN66]|eukprot:XP_002142880.1 SNF2 family helicase [Cryptosporidium muris RN66]
MHDNISILCERSTRRFAECLDFWIMLQRNKERYRINDPPETQIIINRIKLIIQCYRYFYRGFLPPDNILGNLFSLMDEKIIRNGDIFLTENSSEIINTDDEDLITDVIYKSIDIYYNYSKNIYKEKLLYMVDKMMSRRRLNTNSGYRLLKLVAEMNCIRINTLDTIGPVLSTLILSDKWNEYLIFRNKLINKLLDPNIDILIRQYISLPADASSRALQESRLLSFLHYQKQLRNDINNEAQYYDNEFEITSNEKEIEPLNKYIMLQFNKPQVKLFNKLFNGVNKELKEIDKYNTYNINKSIYMNERSISSQEDDFKDSIIYHIYNRIKGFWKYKVSGLQQSRFHLIIDKIPIVRDNIFRNLKKKRILAKHLATRAAHYTISIQSQRSEAIERRERERLQLLRENDLDAYLELIKETKDRRLQELINQTDRFLVEMGLRVQEQKSVSEDNKDNLLEYTNDTSSSISRVSSYYSIAHTISESISENPMKLLVGGELLPYQIVGVEWMLSLYNNNLHGILADEMGLGKTIQTIALLTYLYEHKNNYGPHLIVVPLSTLPNWLKEFNIWSPSLKLLCFKGNRYERKNLIRELRLMKFNICLTTFDFVIREKNILQTISWKHVIVDEGHRLKNSKSKFHIVLHDFQSKNRILLTGTPLQNNINELWSLLNFLLPKVFHSVEDFENWFNRPFSELSSSENQIELTEEEKLFIINRLHSILRPFLLRRVKSDVLQDLPEKREYIIRMELTPWQRVVYGQIKQKAVHSMDISSGKIQYRSVSNTIMQLRKIVNHPYLFVDEYFARNDDIFKVSCKFEILDRMIPKLVYFKHKVLIFCQMTQLMDILGDFLDYRDISYYRLDGTMNIQERKEKMDIFNDPDSNTFVFMLSTRAGGLGLNLQAADTVIIFDSDWNPHQDLQAQSRAHRMGQKNEVRVFRLVSISGVEELVLKRAQKKLDIDQKIIQAGKFNSTEIPDDSHEDSLRELFGKEEFDSNIKITTPSELNRLLARNEKELQKYEEMDKKIFGKEIYFKLLNWSKKVELEKNNEIEISNKECLMKDKIDINEKNNTLVEFEQKKPESPKLRKRGRKQRNFEKNEYQDSSFNELSSSKKNNNIDTTIDISEHSLPYISFMEAAKRIMPMEDIPTWIVKPLNEINAELGFSSESTILSNISRDSRKTRCKSNKNSYIDGVSEHAFLKIVEDYEVGKISDINAALEAEFIKQKSMNLNRPYKRNKYSSNVCSSDSDTDYLENDETKYSKKRNSYSRKSTSNSYTLTNKDYIREEFGSKKRFLRENMDLNANFIEIPVQPNTPEPDTYFELS